LPVSILAYATAPALLFIACMMTRGLSEINRADVTDYVPAVVNTLAMPLTFSIATGSGISFISYAAVEILSGR
jgi:AGZA family xanthine/uracil permease-like MFS transporter